MTATGFTLDFADGACTDTRLVGGKAHGLAAMTQAGIPVSPGFTITTRGWRHHLEQSGLGPRIAQRLAAVDHESIAALEEAEAEIRGWFETTAMESAVAAAVTARYEALCAELGQRNLSVAVRSSATAEDAAGTSFAGEYETYVGVRGAADVRLHVRRCWASVFSARALLYAWKNRIDPLAVEMAVVVQKTVRAKAAGVMFTLSPLTGDRSRLVVEASWGLGLSVVGGEVTPDRWVVAKVGGDVIERSVGDKHLEYIDGQVPRPVAEDRRHQPCLGDDEVQALAAIGRQVERMQKCPQDIEFAIDRELAASDGHGVVLLQCRPVTVLAKPGGSPIDNPVLRQFASNVLSAAARNSGASA